MTLGGKASASAWNGQGKRLSSRQPVFEQIVTGEHRTFVWRCDDYPWERNVWNVHPEFEIHLVRNAAGIALVGDHVGPFEPGHLALVGSWLPHDWVTALPPGELIRGRDIVVQFHPDRLRRGTEVLPEMGELDALFARALRGLAFHGETRRRAAALMEAMGEVDGLERLALFLQLLGVLAGSGEYTVLSSTHFVPDADARTLESVCRALSFIMANFRRDIRVTDVAALMGMSVWSFSRFFKKNGGISFTDYLTTLRIAHACKLLADTEIPVTDVCFEAGYTNVSNFNRMFRAARGMTPSAYRRLAKHRIVTPPVAPSLPPPAA